MLNISPGSANKFLLISHTIYAVLTGVLVNDVLYCHLQHATRTQLGVRSHMDLPLMKCNNHINLRTRQKLYLIGKVQQQPIKPIENKCIRAGKKSRRKAAKGDVLQMKKSGARFPIEEERPHKSVAIRFLALND